MAPTITARETKVAVNDMTRVRLMESPGPGHGHRGFLVQRNHESGGIVIVYSVPEECGFGNSATSTFCNRDIFAIPNSASVIQLRPLADKPASTPEPAGTFGSGSRTGWKLTDTGRIFSREGKEAAHGLDLYQNRHTRRSSDAYPRLVPRQAQGRDHCRCDVHRGCHRPAFRRALEISHKMTVKCPRDPNQLGKLIVDIADPLPNVPRNETGIITENGECFSGLHE